MIGLQYLSSEMQEKVYRSISKNMQKFTEMGIDKVLNVVSLENCEYVAKLHALHSAVPNCLYSFHDREIERRVCEQFLTSGIPALKEWATMSLDKQQGQIQIELGSLELSRQMLLQTEAQASLDMDLQTCLGEGSITKAEFLARYKSVPDQVRQVYMETFEKMKEDGKVSVSATGHLSQA